jgi:uncharacterized protein
MTDTLELDLEPSAAQDPEAQRKALARQLGVGQGELPPVRLLKRSIDARRGRVRVHLTFGVGEAEPPPSELGLPHPKEVKRPAEVVIIGDGPAGLFAAYGLARAGVASIVVDRGKPVQPRRRDLKLLNARGGVDPDSNYCFGEGGAGTYSDGKLYTRSHKRGPVRDVLEILALHGAPADILVDARPHIGSNLLPRVISAMRERLEAVGVEFRFGQRLVELGTAGEGSDRRIESVTLQNVEDGSTAELGARFVVLATGHSARDVFLLAERAGVALEAKDFALGLRIEHPQGLIDRIQFGQHAGHPALGPASYKLVEQVEGRGVFSFCMCPGGWIVPASTDAEHLVVNGMSLSKRNSPYANSGLVVAVSRDDWARIGLEGPLAGVEVQRRAEREAERLGGGENRAPATRVSDFLAGRASSSVPESSYLPGLTPSDVAVSLDATGLPLSKRLRAALRVFARRMKGFDTNEGVLVGVESRTSSPVRMVRDPATLEAIGGLYPSGEGAGYAGGIVSAAVDGLNVASQIALKVTHGGT